MYKELFSLLNSKKNIAIFTFILFLLSFLVGIIFPNIASEYQQKIVGDLISGTEGKRLFGLVSYIIFTNLKAIFNYGY